MRHSFNLEDVRDPKKWANFLAKVQETAAKLGRNNRSRLYIYIDLKILYPHLEKERKLETSLYRLARIAAREDNPFSRRECVIMFNALQYGPEPLAFISNKILERMDE